MYYCWGEPQSKGVHAAHAFTAVVASSSLYLFAQPGLLKCTRQKHTDEREMDKSYACLKIVQK